MVRGDHSVGVVRPVHHQVTPAPVPLPEGVLELRAPRLADARAWSGARLANRARLERAFPAWGPDWSAEQGEVAWAQRWARLRWAASRGMAAPFVMTLAGVLIGEISIAAIDDVSGSGEASVWTVRSHGSAAIMLTAWLLLAEHAFGGARPLARVLAPVATGSRAALGPGLRAAGFEIEATVSRRVGREGLVDHDMWVLHRTAETLDRTRAGLASLRAAGPATAVPDPSVEPTPRTPPAAVVGRAAWRETRDGVRRVAAAVRPDPRAERRLPLAGSAQQVVLRPGTAGDLTAVGAGGGASAPTMPRDTTRWAVEVDDRARAVIGHRTDLGTGTTEVLVAAAPDLDPAVLAAGLGAVLDDLRPEADEPRVLVVRVPVSGPEVLGPELLTGLGLVHLASYRPPPDALDGWGGEDVWRAPART